MKRTLAIAASVLIIACANAEVARNDVTYGDELQQAELAHQRQLKFDAYCRTLGNRCRDGDEYACILFREALVDQQNHIFYFPLGEEHPLSYGTQ